VKKFSLKELLVVVAIIGIIAFALHNARMLFETRNAEATVSIYSVARGVETDLSHWPGGFPSRGITNLKFQTGRIDFDDSYPTNGETLDLSGTFVNAVLLCLVEQSGLYTFQYVHAANDAPATGKVKAYIGDGSEATNTIDMSTIVEVHYFAIGW